MAIELKLPAMGDGVDTGDVLDVLVNEGDIVKKDQGVVELETGKATVQVPSSHAGKVVKIHVKKGQTIPIGSSLLTLEPTDAAAASGKAPAAAPAKAPAAQPTPAPAAPAPAAKAAPAPAPAPAPAAKVQAANPVAVAPAPAPAPVAAEEPSEDDGTIAAGPAVRRFAREVGIDLHRVTGTGGGGRITREDVLAAVRQASQGHGLKTEKGTPSARDNWGPIRAEKMPRIRKTIAEKMHESWSSVPRVTNFDDADVTELERIRLSSKDDYASKGIKLTTLPFVIKAVAMALKAHPAVNASIDMEHDQIIYKQYVNIGIAVDTDRGLVVPSLRSADTMSIPDIARAMAQLAENVRTGSFGIPDLQGSTFTISNLGAIGGTYSTPIINTPEVAILLIGRARKMPVVVEDKIEIRLLMPMSLSYDHRLVDGATAARFLNDVIGFLKAPSRLLLAP